MRILLIEDEVGISAPLKAGLEADYFAVDVASDGERGSFLARTNDYDIIVLDNVLPKKTGNIVCEEIRRYGKTMPIIMLSSLADTDKKVELLNKGADDYLTKPFSFEELSARIHALLRRQPTIAQDVLTANDLVMDVQKHSIARGGKEIYLTRKEFMLLELLLRNKNIAISRARIMEHVWDMSIDPFSNTIEAHILNIRKKIDVRGRRKLMYTLPGVGYKIIG